MSDLKASLKKVSKKEKTIFDELMKLGLENHEMDEDYASQRFDYKEKK